MLLGYWPQSAFNRTYFDLGMLEISPMNTLLSFATYWCCSRSNVDIICIQVTSTLHYTQRSFLILSPPTATAMSNCFRVTAQLIVITNSELYELELLDSIRNIMDWVKLGCDMCLFCEICMCVGVCLKSCALVQLAH